MRERAAWRVAVLILISSFHALSESAVAALGDKVDLSTTQAATSNSLSNSKSAALLQGNFSVRESTSRQLVLREYVNKNGVVFGVVWNGRNHPDLAAFLGTYYGEYRTMHTEQRYERRMGSSAPSGISSKMRGSRRTLQGAHVVVERFGHMGALRGRAFVPELLPEGVSANEIK